jgi:hypothetical protein
MVEQPTAQLKPKEVLNLSMGAASWGRTISPAPMCPTPISSDLSVAAIYIELHARDV